MAERRARVARVRRVQHLRASGEAVQAEGRATSLEGTADHLMRLQQALAADQGQLSGAQFGNAAELAMRLDQLRHGMTDSIVAARATAAERVAQRLAARIAQEGADRLEEQAARAAERARERRLAAVPRPRGPVTR